MTMRPWQSRASASCSDISPYGDLSSHFEDTHVERNKTSQSPDRGEDYGVPKSLVSINNRRQREPGQRAKDRSRSIKEVGTRPVKPQRLDDRCAPGRQTIDGLQAAQAYDQVRPRMPGEKYISTVE